MLFLEKRNSEQQMCVDYRAVNLISKRGRYPLPWSDEIFNDIAKGRIFSRLDLKARYHHVREAEDDVGNNGVCLPDVPIRIFSGARRTQPS